MGLSLTWHCWLRKKINLSQIHVWFAPDKCLCAVELALAGVAQCQLWQESFSQLGLPKLGSSQGVTPGPPAPFFQGDGDLIWGYPQPQVSQRSVYETGAHRLGAVGREQHWQSQWLVRPQCWGQCRMSYLT